MTLHIVHLFPTELGLFGDVGNVMALHKRAEWSGIDVRVSTVTLGEKIPADGDIYVLGSGSSAGVRAVGQHSGSIRDSLSAARDNGASIVAIAAGLHLLTRRIEFSDGSSVDGAGLIDTVATPRPQRLVGEVWGEFAGFVNTGHQMGGDESLVFDVAGIMGSHLHGPLLPMNPELADRLIERHTGTSVRHDDERVRRATVAAEKSRLAIRERLGL